MRRARAPLYLALLAGLVFPLPASAQKYPEKSIRLVVAFPTGAPYILALLMSEKLRETFGQPVVPDVELTDSARRSSFRSPTSTPRRSSRFATRT